VAEIIERDAEITARHTRNAAAFTLLRITHRSAIGTRGKTLRRHIAIHEKERDAVRTAAIPKRILHFNLDLGVDRKYLRIKQRVGGLIVEVFRQTQPPIAR